MGFKTTFFFNFFSYLPAILVSVMPSPLTWDRTQPTFSICWAFIYLLCQWAFSLSPVQHSSRRSILAHSISAANIRYCSRQFSEHCTSERIDTRFKRLDFNIVFFFLLPHSCSFTHLQACYLENLVKCCKVTDFCKYVTRYSTEYAIFLKARKFLQKPVLHPICKPKNNLREWIWVATTNPKWIQPVEVFRIVSRCHIDCPRPSQLQFTLAPPNPGDWNRFYECRDACSGNGQLNEDDKSCPGDFWA